MSGLLYDPADHGTPGDGYVMLDTSTRTHARWLWPSRIPLGKVTIREGDPERAKSTTTLDLAARVSTGSPMPGKSRQREAAGLVTVCAQDDPADAIVPRLLATAPTSPASPLDPWNATSTARPGR